MPFEARFMFPTCRVAGMEVSALLRNTPRQGDPISPAMREVGVEVDLSIYQGGERVMHQPRYGSIGLGEVLSVNASKCPILAESSASEHLVVAHCRLEGGEGYFAQEHQITYERNGFSTGLLYDQLPCSAPGRPLAPIVLLAPKAWVSDAINTYVVFCSIGAPVEQELEIRLLDTQGDTVGVVEATIPVNSVYVLDVRSNVPADLLSGPRPAFCTVVARGGESQFVILTFVKNEIADTMALEHSLSPHYYVTGSLDRVRREALVFGRGR